MGASSASAVGVTEAFKYGYQAYSKYKTCMANIDAGQKCMASDSANIRQILKDIKALRAEIAANHEAVTAQLNLLQKTLDEKTMRDYAALLSPVASHVDRALRAWDGMALCATARAQGKATCIGQTGAEVPTATGIKDFQDVVVYRVGLMSDDLPSTAAVFTGTPLTGDESGLAAANWLLNKRVQDTQAGVTDASLKQSATVPVLTPGLANATSKFVATYRDYLYAYGMLKPFVTAMSGRDAVALAMQDDALEVIYGMDAFSVASRTAVFTLPHMQARSIAYLDPADASHIRVVESGPRSTGRSSRAADPARIFELGTAINAYGRTTTFAKGRPSAFPEDGWFRARVRVHDVEVCPRAGALCKGDAYRFRVYQLARSGNEWITTRMQLRDSQPEWQSGWEKTANGTMDVNFKKDFAHFVTGPATFDWREATYENTYTTFTVGPGSWVRKWDAAATSYLLPTPVMMREQTPAP
jgi:hypothetical protein